MTETANNASLKEKAVSIIRQANHEVTQIQSGQRNPQTLVVHKTGEGHFSVRTEKPVRQKNLSPR